MIKDVLQSYKSSEVQRGKNCIIWLLMLLMVEDLEMLGLFRERDQQMTKFVFRLSCGYVWDGLKETWTGVLRSQASGSEGTQGRNTGCLKG